MSDRQFTTVERARGRWPEILPRLGIETRFLKNKHGPCPLCGGVDRYRFDDRDGTGSYYCNQCGAGTGIILVRKKNGWDHKTACQMIDDIIGTEQTAAALEKRPAAHVNDAEKRASAIRNLLSGARDQSVVGDYLFARGITVTSAVLRGHSACPFFREHKLIARFPAVVAPITGADSSLQSAHRIYVDSEIPKKERKKFMPPVDSINGAAVRLHDPANGILGVAEGIETALAAYELHSIPTWAALNENGIQTFVPPDGVHTIHVFADNDSNFVGQDAAYSLARRLTREKKTVQVHVPHLPDTDWLDVLVGSGTRQ